MSRPARPYQPVVIRPARVRVVPIASTLAGSALGALPVIASAPALPPFGLLMMLAWRLLRPELWPAWAGLPLGLADDLLTGQPLGSGMALWTAVFLAVDRIDNRLPWRDYWLDWSIAAVALMVVMTGQLFAAGLALDMVPTMLPLIAMTILCFPFAARFAASLDRWRLA
ncbi:rod shape-determining protein MreD [Sphingomonas sp. 1P06PA]|uniref:rod shape-determining protein MreD n=1 Tax=Sphingomonas sp. 1P06PA TaxID=554121 RepID=UPI0039A6F9E1